MIRLGFRLTTAGGHESIARLIVTACAVALGVTMLLVTVAGINAVNAQNTRFAWLETGSAEIDTPNSQVGPAVANVDPVWWRLFADEVNGRTIGRVDVAATGPRSPVPPGVAHLPGPGQFVASPALTKLLRSMPRASLANRYPGTQIGTIGAAALPSPDSLVIVIGHTPEDIQRLGDAHLVTAVSTVTPSACNGSCAFVGINASGIDLILSIVVAAMLFPISIFIGTAARLSAARREQRFAAMRLIGATPLQIIVLAAVEAIVAAVAGTIAGFALFTALRPLVVHLNITGATFFPHDLSLHPAQAAVVAVAVPIAAAIAATLTLRRVRISPLGVEHRVTPPPPTPARLLPLAAGIGELAFFVLVGRPATSAAQVAAYLPGFLLVMIGLVVAGPWLTLAGATLLARRSNGPAPLIAGRRLADDPRAGFRSISGLILAMFVTSVSVTVISTIQAYNSGQLIGSAEQHTLLDDVANGSTDNPSTSLPPVSAPEVATIRAVPGVTGLSEIHTAPNTARPSSVVPQQIGPRSLGTVTPPSGLVTCAQLATTPAVGRCPAGAHVAKYEPPLGKTHSGGSPPLLKASSVPPNEVLAQPVRMIAVATTDGAALERARTVLERDLPSYRVVTVAEQGGGHGSRLAAYQQLSDVVIVTSLAIAGCALAVSVAGGISARRRPFSLLRLSGAPISMLRRVVAFESAIPLIAIALVSIGAGFASSTLFVRSQLGETLHWPGPTYAGLVAGGLVAALAVIGATLPLLERVTGPDAARST